MAVEKLKGKTALVTGAGKRVGREIALALASKGVNVVIHYRSSGEEARDAAGQAQALGAKAWTIQADFEEREGYEGLIGRCVKQTGAPLDMLVNSASIFPESTFKDITLDGLINNIKVNAWAPLRLMKEFAQACGKGSIVNLIDARVCGYDWTHVEYLISKRVLLEFTKMAALEYAPDIRVNGVNPGLILPPPGKDESYMDKLAYTVPLKRHGGPLDIAVAVVYLLESDFLTGTVVDVDGGRHLLEYRNGPHNNK